MCHVSPPHPSRSDRRRSRRRGAFLLPSRPASSLAPRNISRKGRPDDATDAPQAEPEPASRRKLMSIFIVFFVVFPAVSILVYRIRYATSSTTQKSAEFYPPEPQHYVKIDVGYQAILNENSRVSEDLLLAYITPWNSKGYEVAKTFNSKSGLTYRSGSCVYCRTHAGVFSICSQRGGWHSFEGRHNVDAGWLSDLRAKVHTLILSRVVLEAVPKELLAEKEHSAKAVQMTIGECKWWSHHRSKLFVFATKARKPLLQWEKNSEEQFFMYADDNNSKHAVYYSSLLSISSRLEEACSWGAGVSIWEIGQGLDYLYDLL